MDFLLDFKRMGDLFLPILNFTIFILLLPLVLFNIPVLKIYQNIFKVLLNSSYSHGILIADNITFMIVLVTTLIYFFQHMTLWIFRRVPHFKLQPLRMHDLITSNQFTIKKIWKEYYSDINPGTTSLNNFLIAILFREIQSHDDENSFIFRIMYRYNSWAAFCMQIVGTTEFLWIINVANIFCAHGIMSIFISVLVCLINFLLAFYIVLDTFKVHLGIIREQFRLYFLNKLQSGSKSNFNVNDSEIDTSIANAISDSDNLWFQLQFPRSRGMIRKVSYISATEDTFRMFIYGMSEFIDVQKYVKHLKPIFYLLGFKPKLVNRLVRSPNKSKKTKVDRQ